MCVGEGGGMMEMSMDEWKIVYRFDSQNFKFGLFGRVFFGSNFENWIYWM